MRLKEHFRDAGCSAEVTVDLERRVEVPKVGSRVNFKELFKEIVSSLAVLNASPEVESVSHAPACRLVTSFGEGILRGIDPGGSVGVDNVAGIQAYELRDMSVSVFTEVTVVVLLEELLDLTGESDSDRIVLIYLLKNGIEYCVILVRGIVGADAEITSREQEIVVILICEGLSIARALTCIVPHSVNVLLGRVGADSDVVAVSILLYHLSDKASRRNEHGVYHLAKKLLVTGVRVVVPEELSGKAEVTDGLGAVYITYVAAGSDGPAVAAILAVSVGVILLYNTVRAGGCLSHISIVVLNVCLKGLGNVGGEGGPIVHLHVDVVPISARPGGVVVSVPGALKVRGERTRAGGCDEEISSVLEVERLEIGAARAVLILCEELVCGERKVALLAIKIERNSAEELGVVSEVSRLKLIVAVNGCRIHVALDLSHSICESGGLGRLV